MDLGRNCLAGANKNKISKREEERGQSRDRDEREEEEQVEINKWVIDRDQDEEEQVEKINDRVVESSPYDDPPLLSFPPGVRFHPKDHELILEYLLLKLHNHPLPYNIFKDVNLYDYNPEDLTAKYKFYCSDEMWYFFTPRDRKYKNGSRPSRSAGGGYWKATGKDKSIFSNDGNSVLAVGTRKVLVFYRGRPPNGTKTNWVMHEFRINEELFEFEGPSSKRNRSSMRLDNWVLCRIFEKARSKKVVKESPNSCPQDHETESHNASPQDHEDNEATIACPQDEENEYPIASPQDYENQFPIACQDGEQIKIEKEESSYGNKTTTSKVTSEIFDCSFMPTSLPTDSVALNYFSSYIPCPWISNSYDSNAQDPYNIMINYGQVDQSARPTVLSNSTLGAQFDVCIRDEVENMNLQLRSLERQLGFLTGKCKVKPSQPVDQVRRAEPSQSPFEGRIQTKVGPYVFESAGKIFEK